MVRPEPSWSSLLCRPQSVTLWNY